LIRSDSRHGDGDRGNENEGTEAQGEL
jgi:hypothetical protein